MNRENRQEDNSDYLHKGADLMSLPVPPLLTNMNALFTLYTQSFYNDSQTSKADDGRLPDIRSTFTLDQK